LGIFLNIAFGLIPTFALAWSIAADERKPLEERVVAGSEDRKAQLRIFELVYGLWALTLSMWNWMRGESGVWIALWAVFGVVALLLAARKRAGTSS
jgi:hypothetical protein